MKRYIYAIGIAAALLATACDKIPSDEYTLFSGISAIWTDGDGAPAEQRALVEKYTGPRCSNCPSADRTLDEAHHQLGDKLVLISINHPTGQGEPIPGDPDMRTEDGTAWDEYFKINAIPAAFLNRRTATQYQSSMENIVPALSNALAEQPVVGIAVQATETAQNQLDISVDIQMLQTYNKPMSLTLALVEDSLVYKQFTTTVTDPEYVHNHMLRDVLTDVWGADVDATGTAGEKRHATFSTYNQRNPNVKLENCHIVAFISDRTSKEVLNAASCTID